MRTIDVCYQVMYCYQLVVPDNATVAEIEELAGDINVPENDSSYVSDSFEIVSIEEDNEPVEDPSEVEED